MYVTQSFFFNSVIRKSFQNDEEWRLFHCDSTLGCRVIQDFDLCKFTFIVEKYSNFLLAVLGHHTLTLADQMAWQIAARAALLCEQ